MGKFLNKAELPLNRTTNATSLLSVFGAIGSAIDGITNDRPIFSWLPMVAIGFAGAIGQWLQGVPTQQTRLIADILHLDGSKTNAEFIRGVFDRVVAAGLVPGLGTPGPGDDVGRGRSPQRRGEALDAELLDRMADGSDYVDRGVVPDAVASIAPPETIRAGGWVDADLARGNVQIEGTTWTRRQFAEFSNGAVDSPDGPRSEAW